MSFRYITFLVSILLILNNCSKDNPVNEVETDRVFKMGFTSWSFGPNLEDVNDTYSFIGSNADIYAEHIDNKIPWNAWINDLDLPAEFVNEISGRVNRRIAGKELLLSVSLLTSNRDELAQDFDGSTPSYTTFDDVDIRNGYFKHIDYLANQFNPDYLVISIEFNELRLRTPDQWTSYKNLINEVKSRIRQLHPEIKIAESISLHNLFEPEVSNPQTYIDDIMNHANQNDFVAISFYPFLKGLSSKPQIQEAFDFLYENTTLPIAFVETAQLAENLVIPNLNVSIDGDENSQLAYLETLIENADDQDFEFIIWWAHRDFDALWETFPVEVKDLGQIWRDTGLLSETGAERPSFTLWSETFLN